MSSWALPKRKGTTSVRVEKSEGSRIYGENWRATLFMLALSFSKRAFGDHSRDRHDR